MDLLNQITNYQNEYKSFLRDYQIILAAIILPLLVACRGLPHTLYLAIKTRLVVSVTVDEARNLSGEYFRATAVWVTNHRIKSLSRRFELTKHGKLSIGEGFQLLRYKGVFFWVHFKRREPTQNGTSSSTIPVILGVFQVSCFKWNLGLFKQVINELEVDVLGIKAMMSVNSQGGHRDHTYLVDFPNFLKYQTPLVAESTYQQIDGVLKNFIAGSEPYIQSGKAYKETIMLYGPPGTGKTSLIRYFAMKYQMDLIAVAAERVDAGDFLEQSHFAQHHHGSIILIEDIDSNTNFVLKENEEKPPTIGGGQLATYGTSLSKLLNILDGIVPLHNVVVVMTTNFPEKLYPSIYRPGRVDQLIHIDYLDFEHVLTYLGWTSDDERYQVLINHPHKNSIPAATLVALKNANSVEVVDRILNDKGVSLNLLKTHKSIT